MSEKMKVSNMARVEALFAKFPKLRPHFDSIFFIRKVSIRKLDIELMHQDAGYYATSDWDGDQDEWLRRTILIFTKDWELLGQVGKKTVHHPRITNRRFLGLIPLWDIKAWDEHVLFYETVESALKRVGLDQAYWIVGTVIEGNEARLIISTPGKDRTVTQILEEEREKAAQQITSEFATIV